MKFTTDYIPPFKGEYLPKGDDNTDWIINAMVIYRPRQSWPAGLKEPCNGSYQLFWPVNPWDVLEKAKENQRDKTA